MKADAIVAVASVVSEETRNGTDVIIIIMAEMAVV